MNDDLQELIKAFHRIKSEMRIVDQCLYNLMASRSKTTDNGHETEGRCKHTQAKFWDTARQNKNGCWLWSAARDRKGYGMFRFNGKQYKSHRLAWFFDKGVMPGPEQFVCHSCDNPPCINPRHLFLGSNLDNQRDARVKGRLALKLTAEQVMQIKTLLSEGKLSQEKIANIFGVTQNNIYLISKGKIWAHIP